MSDEEVEVTKEEGEREGRRCRRCAGAGDPGLTLVLTG